MTYPLEGIKVLDLGGYIAGAYCGTLLAESGADVIKIESESGDAFRSMGAPFNSWNRGKKALCLNLKHPEGRNILYQLVAQSDVVNENFRPGITHRLKIDYDTLKTHNPSIIYSSVTGYGSSGPFHNNPAFDPLMQAQSGIMVDQGGVENPPIYLRTAVSDYSAAILAAFGISMALFHRKRTGEGQLVETNLLNAATALQSAEFVSINDNQIDGNHLGISATYRFYETSDKWIFISCSDDLSWEKICMFLDLKEFVNEFPSIESRHQNSHKIAKSFSKIFKSKTAKTWESSLRKKGIRIGISRQMSEIHEEPQAKSTNMLTELKMPTSDNIRMSGLPFNFSRTPGKLSDVGAPTIGQHTDEILGGLGFSQTAIKSLKNERIVI